jgi:hypothetical protein
MTIIDVRDAGSETIDERCLYLEGLGLGLDPVANDVDQGLEAGCRDVLDPFRLLLAFARLERETSFTVVRRRAVTGSLADIEDLAVLGVDQDIYVVGADMESHLRRHTP